MTQHFDSSVDELLESIEVVADSNETRQTHSMIGALRRLVPPALLLGVGVLVGIGIHRASQDRIVPPVSVADGVTLDEHGYTIPTQHGPLPNGVVPYGGGFIVGAEGISDTTTNCYAATCAISSTCCRNLEQVGYCCAQGHYCHENGCLAPGTSYCFAGDSNVDVRGKGTVAMQDLHVGDHVLAHQGGAKLAYEPILGFLHTTPADEFSTHLIISHPAGKLRISPNHIVFLADGSDKLAANLLVGDELAVAEGSGKVASIESTVGNAGMYAPLTASGTIVVDGAIASNYATHSKLTWIPHTAIHSAFFPLRLYHALGLHSLLAADKQAVDGKHPFVSFLEERVQASALRLFNLK